MLIRTPLEQEDLYHLKKEFSYYQIMHSKNDEILPDSLWSQVEILFGQHLKQEELDKTPLLKWVHLPNMNTSNLCLHAIQQRENILITRTEEYHGTGRAEFVFAVYLLFAKSLLSWKGDMDTKDKEAFKQNIWLNQNKTWLQVGLSKETQPLLHKVKTSGLKTIGIDERGSFHSECSKVCTPDKLHAILPSADIFSVFAPKEQPFHLTADLLCRTKKGSILLVLNQKVEIDTTTLIKMIQNHHFRGVFIDQANLSPNLHTLRALDTVLLTPEISTYPHFDKVSPFRVFRHNLRQFMHQNFYAMEGLYNTIS